MAKARRNQSEKLWRGDDPCTASQAAPRKISGLRGQNAPTSRGGMAWHADRATRTVLSKRHRAAALQFNGKLTLCFIPFHFLSVCMHLKYLYRKKKNRILLLLSGQNWRTEERKNQKLKI
jgi:hypothetical protein